MKKGIMVTKHIGEWKKTFKLNQLVYFKDVLTSEWKSENVLHWGRGFIRISTGEEKQWIPPILIKIWFEKEKSLDKEKLQLIHRGDNPTNCKKNSYGLGQSSILIFAGKHIFEKSRDFGHLDAQKKSIQKE